VSGRAPGGPTIRPAEPSDIDALLRIETVFPTDRADRRGFRHAVRSPTIICRVAEMDGQVCGYVIVERRRTSDLGRLTSIAVSPETSGSGIGRRLLDAAESEARAAGCARMRLEVRADNAPARRLYEAAGYTLIETVPGYYEDGADACRYEKVLSAAPGKTGPRPATRR
jgi:ribosomal-protein-alanine N-acetyltransferase